MNKFVAAICFMLAASPLALAQDKAKGTEQKAAPATSQAKKEPSAKQKAQQDRMRDCNQQAGDKKLEGDARKSYMSSCLKGGGATKQTAQQDKMKTCNKQAGDKQLKGDERNKFMSACLKG